MVVVEEDMYGMIRQNTHRDMYNFPGHSKIVLACVSALDQITAILLLFGTFAKLHMLLISY